MCDEISKNNILKTTDADLRLARFVVYCRQNMDWFLENYLNVATTCLVEQEIRKCMAQCVLYPKTEYILMLDGGLDLDKANDSIKKHDRINNEISESHIIKGYTFIVFKNGSNLTVTTCKDKTYVNKKQIGDNYETI